jgi:hypothetical protein
MKSANAHNPEKSRIFCLFSLVQRAATPYEGSSDELDHGHFKNRRKSNTAIKSRTSWQKWRIAHLALAVVDVQSTRSNPRLRFQVCNTTNPKLAGEIYVDSEVTRCFARDFYRLASVRLALWRASAGSETTCRETAREEEQSRRRFLRRRFGHRPGQTGDLHTQTPSTQIGDKIRSQI